MRCQQVLATEIANHSVTRAAVVPVGLDQADVLVNLAVGSLDLGGPEGHGVVLLMMLIPVFFWREPRHWRGWAIVAAIAVLLGPFELFGYMKKSDDWTCSYAGTSVVVGDELTPDGARYMSQHPDMTCKDVIWNHAG